MLRFHMDTIAAGYSAGC